ncbi:MAG: 50S ribosomal protein L33 [Candidatus Colwellbacteria bacterium CG10_big_fil_rev_8_21_14_0_10_42_22]|uniref:Large ribosomal subunit protein bL33 n=1 Tax=Candidatus Colwellbacteria bacterium CG10_big_fil_rev_8_21_14_0_10_42_22 TaxID=1974540 RepID=A0A2H0VHG1_9BACT|nr:MAG: 50S ribosomal protein L33 [Candidatus Colwellbacteria bacterium CG10_big_fil_rev_8_21_14_0_10_42_22]
MGLKSKFSEYLVTMKCTECSRKNYYTRKNKRVVEGKLGLKKYCKWCRKHTPHKEARLKG